MFNTLTFFILIIIFIMIMYSGNEEHHMNCPYFYRMRYNRPYCPYCRRLS